jgi:putative methyltransferase
LPYRWNASHETNRGCPYSCTFCDWGSAVFTKLRQFDPVRLEAELEWFGNQKIEILYNCDANLGILDRDLELTRKLAAVKRATGYPVQFRPSFAKKSNENVFRIATELQKVGLQRGITLSMQSMSDETLTAIRRRNIKAENLAERLDLYRAHGMPTYTELILGLPGESYDSFADGVDSLLQAGQHEGLLIYLCEVLPNSEMARPDYQEVHRLKSVRMPIMLGYATPASDHVVEYFDVVVETATMSHSQWLDCFEFAWAVQCFHCLNITQLIAVYLWLEHGVSYRSFYERLIAFCDAEPQSLLGTAYRQTQRKLADALSGSELGELIPEYGDMAWNPEEATFLRLALRKDELYREIADVVALILQEQDCQVPGDLLADLLTYQSASLVGPREQQSTSLRIRYNLNEYFDGALRKSPPELIEQTTDVSLSAAFACGSSLTEFAVQGVRYGRKNNHLRRTPGPQTSTVT